MIISRTPFRVSFFGGGTDYPVWYRENTGTVISTTIDKYCYLTCRYLPPFFEHKHRIVYSKIENVKGIDAIKHPAVKAILRFMMIKNGIEMHHDGDVPARAGLGSSSAFTVGLLNSLYALKGIMPTKFRLAKEAIHIEREVLKESVGSQDQIAVAYGGFNKISFKKDDEFLVEPVILERERLEQLQNHLILFFTGFSRIASKIAKKQVEQTRRKHKELTAIHQMVGEAINILTSKANLMEFGKLLHESWLLKKSMTSMISTVAIDDIYNIAMRAGASGGKILGAGGGGFMLIFASPHQQAAIRKKLKKLIEVKFRFENEGSRIIFYKDSGIDSYAAS